MQYDTKINAHKAMRKRTQLTNNCMNNYRSKNHTMNATYTISLATKLRVKEHK